MKKRNIALAALLVLGSAVLAASMVLVVVPQMKSGTATDLSLIHILLCAAGKRLYHSCI